jgi:hypothetical protein
MKVVACAGVLALFAFAANAGIQASWEVHILDLYVVSCAAPTIRNVHLLPRSTEVTDEQALAALPLGRIIRARVFRSRVVEEFLDNVQPARVHEWRKETGRQPQVFFMPVAVSPNAGPDDLSKELCDQLTRGTVVQLITTTASDCDTSGRMDLCLFSPLSILAEPDETERTYAAR